MWSLWKHARKYHAITKSELEPFLRIKVIPILQDNYSYVIIDDANKDAILVDPAEPEPIMVSAASYTSNTCVFIVILLQLFV